jgi:hypothetical protein
VMSVLTRAPRRNISEDAILCFSLCLVHTCIYIYIYIYIYIHMR